jgi:uncharacterized protein (DUF305 family)
MKIIFSQQIWSKIVTAIALSGIISACNTTAQTPKDTTATSPVKTEIKPNIMADNMGHNMDHNMMDLGPSDRDYDLRFIDAMIPHHEGAIIMANDLLKKSKRPELIKLAKNIIKDQEKEIKQMKKWRKTWYAKAPNTPISWHSQMNHSMAMTPEQIKMMRMDMDLGNANDQYDLRFINAMIPHHEGALTMAEDLLKKSKRSEMKKLGKNIISSQKAEINQMKQWRKSWYGE